MAFTNMTLKGVAAAGLVALSMALAPQAAEAKTKVYVGIGTGFYGPGWNDCWGRPHIYCGPHYYYPRYRPYYFYEPDNYYYRKPYSYRRLSCVAARNMVRNRGYRNVVARDCTGTVYSFRAVRAGHRVIVNVSAQTGRITSVRRG